MPRTSMLALVMAGGAGGRMDLLTEQRAKPVLPFAGIYRLIDFPLSNCVHSAIENVWIIEQFQPHSLNDHLANGRPWDLDRTYGGLRILPPFTGGDEGGWHRGNADALYHNRRLIREFNPDVLLVLSADHIYKLDYRQAIDAHRELRADVTIVTTQVAREEAGRFGNIVADAQGKVTKFAYKPDEPLGETVMTEVFVYDTRRLLEMMDALVARSGGKRDDEDDVVALKDYGNELLPALVQQGRAYAFPLDGYWRDVGTIDSYWQGHMDLLQPEPPLNLDEPGWPILTYGAQRLPAWIAEGARIDRSLISPGSRVHGHVERSVLGPGVVIEPGASVRDAVIFGDTVIGAGATVERAIVDSGVRLGERARVGVAGGPIALVGRQARLAAEARVEAGGRVKPRTED